MAVKKENKIVQITLPPFHQKKLAIICNKTGLNNSAVIQRLIEGHDPFNSILQGELKERGQEG